MEEAHLHVEPAEAGEPVVVAEGISFSYGNGLILEDVSLSVGAGEFAALVGPNGSGKSTLLRILVGLLPPAAGIVRLFGSPPERLRQRWRIGYVPQRRSPEDLPTTVEEVVASGRLARSGWWRPLRRADRLAVGHALSAVALTDLRDRRIGELSVGQQQRAFIAKALASEPQLFLLDEPVAGVDSESQRLFRDSVLHLVREHSAAVLLVSHELGAVATDLDRVIVLKRRVLFDGTPRELREAGVSLGVHRADLPLWLEELG